MDFLRGLLNLPPGASTVADEIDVLHATVIGVAMLGSIVLALMALNYLRRYRVRSHSVARPVPELRAAVHVEMGIIAFVATLFLGWWFCGVRQYDDLRDPPEDAIEVYVVAKQWMFTFVYPDGRTSADVLHVPAGRPVKLVMTSRDVIHSFFVPAFRIKFDVLPDRYTMIWFEAPDPGEYELFCTEFCGSGHSTMRGHVRVLAPADYQEWVERDAPPDVARPLAAPIEEEIRDRTSAPVATLAERGVRVAAEKGCLRCHTTDGSPHIGPSFAGLYARDVTLVGDRTLVVDEAYLTRSMMDPQADVVAGYVPVMPSYRGQLAPGEAAALVELIKSLRSRERWDPGQPPPAEPIYPPPDAVGRPTYPQPREAQEHPP